MENYSLPSILKSKNVTQCAICTKEFAGRKVKPDIVKTPCNHYFDLNCITAQLHSKALANRRCALCHSPALPLIRICQIDNAMPSPLIDSEPVHAVRTGDLNRLYRLIKSDDSLVNKLHYDCTTGINQSLLHFACEYNNLKMVKLLIQNEAKLNQLSSNGKTAAHVAREKKHNLSLNELANELQRSDPHLYTVTYGTVLSFKRDKIVVQPSEIIVNISQYSFCYHQNGEKEDGYLIFSSNNVEILRSDHMDENGTTYIIPTLLRSYAKKGQFHPTSVQGLGKPIPVDLPVPQSFYTTRNNIFIRIVTPQQGRHGQQCRELPADKLAQRVGFDAGRV